MSSARIAKLEALLARVAMRRGQPRLALVQSPAIPTPMPAPEAEPTKAVAAESALAQTQPPGIEAQGAASVAAPAAVEHPSELTPTLPPPASARVPESVAPEAMRAPTPEPAAVLSAQEKPAEASPAASAQPAHDTTPDVQVLAAEPPREEKPAPRLSLPVRPSLPSPELVPDALPFTLLTERPPAMPTAKDALDLGAISLTAAPNMSADFGKGIPGTIEVSTRGPTSGALTVVPSARASIPNDLDDVEVLPPLPPLPSVAFTKPPSERPAAAGESIVAPRPVLKDPATVTTSALRSPGPRTFGAVLERSLALRPRAER
ncbi:MAG: hypothetical protein RL385_4340 [Pseudomonadota bacterium]|jgi:hypothetical protein